MRGQNGGTVTLENIKCRQNSIFKEGVARDRNKTMMNIALPRGETIFSGVRGCKSSSVRKTRTPGWKFISFADAISPACWLDFIISAYASLPVKILFYSPPRIKSYR